MAAVIDYLVLRNPTTNQSCISVFIAAVNIRSPKAGTRIQVVFFAVKLIALIAIILGSVYQLCRGESVIYGVVLPGIGLCSDMRRRFQIFYIPPPFMPVYLTWDTSIHELHVDLIVFRSTRPSSIELSGIEYVPCLHRQGILQGTLGLLWLE